MKKFLFAVAVTVPLAGCGVVTHIEGAKINKDNVINIKPGETSRQMVIDSFGNPADISNSVGEEKFVYVYREKKVPSYFGVFENETRSAVSSATLEVTIRNGVVHSYKYKSAEN